MRIDRPIFIVGAGRSGTTILNSLLTIHPEVCWFSNYTDKFPSLSYISILHRLLDIPFLGIALKKSNLSRNPYRFVPKPSEAGNIYHSYCRFEHARKTTEDHLNKSIEAKFKSIIKAHLRFTGKPRFLNKQTANNQRIRLINKMFPNAFYIHIIRDGRAVANSLFRIKWWDETDIWWLGEKVSEWNERGRQSIELCALHWEQDVKEILNNKHLFQDRYLEIRYEQLLENTRSIIHEVFNFCELNRSSKIDKLLPESLPDMNVKWKEQLTDHEKSILSDTIGHYLLYLGYDL